MSKNEIIDLFGNVLLGITCPFTFLVSENPAKDLFRIEGCDNLENGNNEVTP